MIEERHTVNERVNVISLSLLLRLINYNGDVELYMEHTSDVDQIMEIVEQSYRLRADE